MTSCGHTVGQCEEEVNCEALSECLNVSRSQLYHCDAEMCLHNVKVCDGRSDCKNGQDEQKCHQHQCVLGYVPPSFIHCTTMQ